MTLKTWKEEFYPVRPTKRMTKKQAVEHSLRKWQGLTKSNLKKHGISVEWKNIYSEDGYLSIDATSCALCKKYFNDDSDFFPCASCPLAKSLGEIPCDKNQQPYDAWVVSGDPKPMIKALKKLLKEL